MSDIYYREYGAVIRDSKGIATPAPDEDSLVNEGVISNPTTAQTITPSSHTRMIMLSNNGVYHYTSGASPTATTSNTRISDGNIIFLGIDGRKGRKISVIIGA